MFDKGIPCRSIIIAFAIFSSACVGFTIAFRFLIIG
jgi:hypothetical protein